MSTAVLMHAQNQYWRQTNHILPKVHLTLQWHKKLLLYQPLFGANPFSNQNRCRRPNLASHNSSRSFSTFLPHSHRTNTANIMPIGERKKKTQCKTNKQTTVQASNGKGYVHKRGAPCDTGVAVNSKRFPSGASLYVHTDWAEIMRLGRDWRTHVLHCC